MKILHLVTQDYGGAGRAAYRIFTGIRTLGHDVRMLVLNKNSNDPDVYVLHESQVNSGYTDSPATQYISPRFQQVWRDWMGLMNSFPNRPQGLEIFTDTRSFTKFVNSPEVLEADILNFHWMAGFIDFDEIAQLLPDKPIVWTLHDMNPFTGGCHYAGDCLKYTQECGACPQLGSIKKNDISQQIWQEKYNSYKNLNIHVLTPSKWLGDCAKKSSLFGRFPVHVIANGFPLDKYFPKNRESLRTNLNIPLDQKVILFGADNILNDRKGLKYFLHALTHIVAKRKDIALAFFGHFQGDFKIPFEVPVYQFGSVSDEMKLSAIYSLADVFVIPSLEDNLPNTVVESMASGTPVVGFDIGGIPDMVENGVTGKTARLKDVEDLANSIIEVIDHKNYEQLRENCWEKAQREYSLPGQAAKYVRLYEEILAANPVRKTTSFEKININLNSNILPSMSIVTPSFNQKEWLEECIDSILSQNYPGLEYVIMDGGSTDGSTEIIKKYEKHLTYWQSKKDGGQYAAINEGFSHTTGEIMTWLNSDDRMYPGTFHLMGSIFSKRKDVNWVTGRGNIINRNGYLSLTNFRRWSREDLFTDNYKYIQQEGTFWRRNLWDKAGGNISLEYKLASDFELWVRFFRYSRLHSVINLNAGFRKHEEQKSSLYLNEYEKEALKIINSEVKSGFNPEFDVTSPSPILVDSNTLIGLSGNNNLENLLVKIKQSLDNGELKKAASFISSALYYDVNNKDLQGILKNLYSAASDTVYTKALLWNNLFKNPDNPEYYNSLLPIEIKQNRIDNLNELFRLAKDYGIPLNIQEKLRNDVQYFWELLLKVVHLNLYLEAGDETNTGNAFNGLTKLLQQRYLFPETLDFTLEEVKIFAADANEAINQIDYESAIQIISGFFKINIKIVLG